jgi:hypothetical protein
MVVIQDREISPTECTVSNSGDWRIGSKSFAPKRAAEHNSVYGGARCTNGKIRHAEKVYDYPLWPKTTVRLYETRFRN